MTSRNYGAGTYGTGVYGEGSTYSLVAAQGSYGLTGEAVGLRWGHKLLADQASFSLTGEPSGLRWGHKLAASFGAYGLFGWEAFDFIGMPGEVGRFVLTGFSAGYSIANIWAPTTPDTETWTPETPGSDIWTPQQGSSTPWTPN